jgi:CheY-like chemotaxis protein
MMLASSPQKASYRFDRRVRFDLVHSGDDAWNLLQTYPYQLLITESRLRGTDGKTLTRKVRDASGMQAVVRDIPIIMVTADAEITHVHSARDVGITEFLRKPFTTKTLAERIIQVIDHPRIFVQSPGFVGPCRRRKEPLPPGIACRRKILPTLQQRLLAEITHMNPSAGHESEISLIFPNTDLQKAIGKDMLASRILNDDVIAETQAHLLRSTPDYIAWAREDLAGMERAFSALCRHTGDAAAYDALCAHLYAIQSLAGVFHYDLGGEVAALLLAYLSKHYTLEERHLLVIRKHIDSLLVIFTENLHAFHATRHSDFLDSLRSLTEKMG